MAETYSESTGFTPRDVLSINNTSRPAHPMSMRERVVRGAAGSMLTLTAALGMYQATKHSAEILSDRLKFNIDDEATPSDDFAELYKGAMDGVAILGGVALANMGIRRIRIAISPSEGALNNLAVQGKSGGKLKTVTASGLTVLATGMFGFSGDIGNGVGGAQANALSALTEGFPPDTTILSNSGKPELATTPILSNQTIEKLAELHATGRYDVNMIPIRYSWDSAIREKDSKNATPGKEPKILSVAMSFPAEVAGIPDADKTCNEVPVRAASALGQAGDKFSMAGSNFIIKDTLNNSGPNTVPIIMTNDSYARCFASNPEQPYNLLALNGNKSEEIDRFLKDSDILSSTTNINSRVRKSTLADFIHETDRTSKNNSNGIILIFAGAVAMAAAGMLANKAKADFANNRSTNSMLSANGMSNKDIARISYIRSSREAALAALYATPFVVAMDYVTATGTPGAVNIAPNILTFLTMYGFAAGVGRLALGAVAPSEIRKLNPAQRGMQA